MVEVSSVKLSCVCLFRIVADSYLLQAILKMKWLLSHQEKLDGQGQDSLKYKTFFNLELKDSSDYQFK